MYIVQKEQRTHIRLLQSCIHVPSISMSIVKSWHLDYFYTLYIVLVQFMKKVNEKFPINNKSQKKNYIKYSEYIIYLMST